MLEKHFFFYFLLLAVTTNHIVCEQNRKKGKHSYSLMQKDEGKTIFLKFFIDHVVCLHTFIKCDFFNFFLLSDLKNTLGTFTCSLQFDL